jgi:hypothetical protein
VALKDTRDGRDLLRLFGRSDETVTRLRAAMKEAGFPLDVPAGSVTYEAAASARRAAEEKW